MLSMRKYKLLLISSVVLLLIFVVSCVKKIDIPETNNVEVTLANSGAKFVTTNITVNPKDSIFFDFTITSSKDMKFVGIQKNATNLIAFIAKDTLSTINKNSFSAVKKFAADSAAGIYNYKIVALDALGYYVGSKEIIVTVTSDFDYFSARLLQMPDSINKTNKCYFSTTSTGGQTFSYSNGASNSASIDFGYFYDTTKVLIGTVLTEKGHTIYSLNNTITPFLPYDLSSWTKNATLLKLSTTVTFASLTSGGALRTAGIAALTTGAVTRVSSTDRPTASIPSHLTGAVILFKTVNGKYGAFTVNYTNHNRGFADSYMNVDVKVQK
jgi:hypothetical protein